MNVGIERRRDPRIPVDWPVVLMTPQGALFLFSEMPEIGDEFQITLKSSEDHQMSVTCEKAWSGSIIVDESVYSGIGAHFTKISSSKREIIASMVAEYYLI